MSTFKHADFTRIFADCFAKEPDIANTIFCFHDSRGKILHIINEKADFPSTILKASLLEDMDLSVHYPFDKFNPDVENNILPQRYRPEKLVLSSGFFTCLPLTVLYSKKTGEDLFLGRLVLNNLLPNFSTPGITGIILADMVTDTLVGMNDHFYGFFSERYAAPAEMLNRPLKEFLSPTPRAHQEHLQSHYLSAPERLSFSPSRPGLEEVTGLPAGRGLFTRVAEPVNMRTEDFELTVRVAGGKGNGPAFFLSAPEFIRPEWEIDYNGYMAGVEPVSGRPVIKKRGLIAARGEKTGPLPGERVFVFTKAGSCLAFYCDGKKLAGFYDRDLIRHEGASLFVASRPDDGSAVLEVALRKGPCAVKQAGDDDYLVVEFLSAENRAFLVEPFYNATFAQARYLNVGGFLLTNISEFHNKALRLESRLADEIREKEALKKKVRQYEDRGASACWGVSRAMATVRRDAESIAETDATVLIEGETGTGKEVLARHIHQQSARSGGPFIKVDCATVPVNLIESILFGHVKGAFTGAVADSLGMLRSADKGTLFLDEAGNLTVDVQAKLLQFFNDLTVTPVGGTESFKADVRCVIASNRSLLSMVREGKFREDLYYRINVLSLHMPLLRERPEDLPLLCEYFMRQYAKAHRKPAKPLSREALARMERYGWPGNVRELQNIMQRAVIYSKGAEIEAQDIHLPETETPAPGKRGRKARTPFAVAKTDPAVIEKALRENHGVVKKAAAALNIDRGTLYNYLKKRNLTPGPYRRGLA